MLQIALLHIPIFKSCWFSIYIVKTQKGIIVHIMHTYFSNDVNNK